ncbi:hypothetical protein B0J13DRAFT_193038 [Dactylonectria estremocensis]|uniref:Uncharacterized protein n=1 Tax=Dactylonectria estremocensis TaxID=1079267 RepID=A0A9P9IGN5_9HYPO|nr:hypothetical protein B0J13DRAFT_193038 [Dactylonectria estremocensis]
MADPPVGPSVSSSIPLTTGGEGAMAISIQPTSRTVDLGLPTSALPSSLNPATATTQPSSSLPPSKGNVTPATQSLSSESLGLGPGPLAGIAIGAVAVVVLILLGLFLWWRRRRQRARSNNAISMNDSQGCIPELEQPKESEIAVASKSPAELRGSAPPPPATEMEATAPLSEVQTKEIEDNKVLEYSLGVTSSELLGEDKPLHSKLPTENTPHEMDSNQQHKEPSLVLQTQWMGCAQQQPQTLLQTLPQSPSLPIASPDTGVSILPSALGGAGSLSRTETMSPVSQSSDAESAQTRGSLMDKYAQLEARRQRLLELKQIEEEQADVEAKLRATAE